MQTYAQNESNYIDTILGIEAVKINNKQDSFIASTKSIYKDYQENSYELNKISLQYQYVSETIGAFYVVGLIIYASYLVVNDNFTAGGVIAVLQLSSILIASVGALAILNIQFQEAKVALNRMFEYTSLKQETTSKSQSENLRILKMQLKNIGFGYPGRGKILENISADILKGQCLGVTGEIGSGKSTLLQIIAKFYAPNSGEIILNEKYALKDQISDKWRDCLGMVSQQTHIFTGDVFYNISLSRDFDKKEIIEFCQNFGFNRYLELLPQSYNIIVGEEGINLSGGQKQIIALTRALFKTPQILLLDEVTSAMDSKTENFIIK